MQSARVIGLFCLASSLELAVRLALVLFRLGTFSFLLVFAFLDNLPVVHSRDGNLHGLLSVSMRRPAGPGIGRTVICSLKKSKSSSQFDKLCFAVDSLDCRSVSASSTGYDNMTFACRPVSLKGPALSIQQKELTPNQMYTSSVGGIFALVYSVSLSSKVVSIGSSSLWIVSAPRSQRGAPR